ncbi:hypothetical protein [Nocardioides sp. YIM 152315]|uniref:hypothetical protein n=1 Tax=Nocardioides sp. YIM 152315 TaxID=3031760 RepID=UPI0023DB3831|nr:hypothetical protein [Nocardioides sp. YIM 152315]MDF1602262.1 hypothetical protein [Nocardioides sp. YIM 152315]
MTSYSVLSSPGKATVIATWPGQWADSHSAKITTCTDPALATRLADDLTWISEQMWDAAAWLDIYEHAEDLLAQRIDDLRSTAELPNTGAVSFAGSRHADSLTGESLADRLGHFFPETMNQLTRAQRLSVADELSADAAARTESLQLLPIGHDPAEPNSRVWQAAAITRATQSGIAEYLPEGAASWSARLFDNDRGPAERWGARNLLVRLEQIAAAAQLTGARGGVGIDPFEDHLVFPHELLGVHLDHEGTDDAVVILKETPAAFAGGALAKIYRAHAAAASPGHGGYFPFRDVIVKVRPALDLRANPWDRDVFAPIEVSVRLEGAAGSTTKVLGTLEVTDSGGFESLLGPWASGTTFR